MNREEKALLVASLKNDFAQSKAAFLVNYQGLTVEQVKNLRKGLRSKGGRMKIAKARLIKMAAQDIPEINVMLPYFKEQIGVVFVQQEAQSIAKVLSDFAKEHEKLSIVAGSLESKLIDKATIMRIASLPPKEVLLAQLCGTLKAPIAKLAFVLKMVQSKSA